MLRSVAKSRAYARFPSDPQQFELLFLIFFCSSRIRLLDSDWSISHFLVNFSRQFRFAGLLGEMNCRFACVVIDTPFQVLFPFSDDFYSSLFYC